MLRQLVFGRDCFCAVLPVGLDLFKGQITAASLVFLVALKSVLLFQFLLPQVPLFDNLFRAHRIDDLCDLIVVVVLCILSEHIIEPFQFLLYTGQLLGLLFLLRGSRLLCLLLKE